MNKGEFLPNILRLSVLDKFGNTVYVPLNVFASHRKSDVLKARSQLNMEIKNGKYDHYADATETLSADIEVHDCETNELLYIEEHRGINQGTVKGV